MKAISVNLPPDLKARIARAAKRGGTSIRSFILEAIAEKVEQAEIQADFRESAEQRYSAIAATDKTIPWKDMRRYLEIRATGKIVARPRSRAQAPVTSLKAAHTKTPG